MHASFGFFSCNQCYPIVIVKIGITMVMDVSNIQVDNIHQHSMHDERRSGHVTYLSI